MRLQIMQTVELANKTADEVMDIVRELRQQGLVQGNDFDFAYNPARWDDMTGTIESSVKFKFYTEKYATLFTLKWA